MNKYKVSFFLLCRLKFTFDLFVELLAFLFSFDHNALPSDGAFVKVVPSHLRHPGFLVVSIESPGFHLPSFSCSFH